MWLEPPHCIRLQACSNRKGFRWFNKFKPLLDAYYAPYKKGTRFWAGFLLIVRISLYAVYTQSENLSALPYVFSAIAVLSWLMKGIYVKTYLDFLEASFIFNITVLSILARKDDVNDNACVTEYRNPSTQIAQMSLVSIAFAEYVGIVIFHIYLRLKDRLKCFERIKSSKKVRIERQVREETSDVTNTSTVGDDFSTFREPLLDFLK